MVHADDPPPNPPRVARSLKLPHPATPILANPPPIAPPHRQPRQHPTHTAPLSLIGLRTPVRMALPVPQHPLPVALGQAWGLHPRTTPGIQELYRVNPSEKPLLGSQVRSRR